MEVLARVESSPYRPSRSLLAHVAQMIKGVPIYTLLDEQLVVFDKVMSLVRPHSKAPGKTIVLTVFTGNHFGSGEALENAIGLVAKDVADYFSYR